MVLSIPRFINFKLYCTLEEKMTKNGSTSFKPEEEMIPKSQVQALLDEKIAELSSQFEAKFAAMMTEQPRQPKQEIIEERQQRDNNIRLDDYVDVISLCPMPLNLSTQGNGRGMVFKFSKFGEKKSILYKDLVNIIENQRTFLEAGYFYILNKDVIRKSGLDDMYSKILTQENILQILDGDSKEALSLYSSCNERQKELIVEMILQRLLADPESIDLNLVDKISKASGTDILGKINFSKEIIEAEEETNK